MSRSVISCPASRSAPDVISQVWRSASVFYAWRAQDLERTRLVANVRSPDALPSTPYSVGMRRLPVSYATSRAGCKCNPHSAAVSSYARSAATSKSLTATPTTRSPCPATPRGTVAALADRNHYRAAMVYRVAQSPRRLNRSTRILKPPQRRPVPAGSCLGGFRTPAPRPSRSTCEGRRP
jgi:hypothetical protein